MTAPKKCPPLLTVVFRDDGTLVWCNDTSRYRSVTIELTDAQRELLSMRWIGAGGECDHEIISRCFIEPEVLP